MRNPISTWNSNEGQRLHSSEGNAMDSDALDSDALDSGAMDSDAMDCDAMDCDALVGEELNGDTLDGDSLDGVLEQVIVALESDDPLDKEMLAAQFPKHHAEVCQFIDNWLSMEQATSQLAVLGLPFITGSNDPLTGKQIGDYEILGVINRGGMGVVYRAIQKRLGRVVALKLVWDKHRDTVRFRMEAEAAAALHHPNIVAIHEVNEFEGQPYLSMQLVDGESLQDRIQSGPLPLRESAQLLKTIADAVHYAHQRGILHRDLKPANVLLDRESTPYVSDFGLAKQMGNSVELTRSGAILGTPSYMSPEQAMGRVKSLTVAADVYGLGAILYALLTGIPPFRAESELLTLRKVIDDPPRLPRTLRPEIDRNLETICLKCLEKLPASRYGSARQLSDDLGRYLRGEPVLARPVTATERHWRWCRRNPALAALWGVVLFSIGSTLFFSIHLAWSEYKSRIESEQATKREFSLREQANSARAEAESKSTKAIQALGELYVSNGLWASQMELDSESLLWFTRASQLEGLDSKQLERNKTRSISWMNDSPSPAGALQMPVPFEASSARSHLRSFAFRPNGTELMCQSNDGLVVWNYQTDERWSPSEQSLMATCGAWGPFGDILAIGMDDGDVRILESNAYETLACLPMDEPVTGLRFSSKSDLIAVVTGRHVHVHRVGDGKPAIKPIAHPATVRQVVISDSGNYLATVADDKKTRVFSLVDLGNPESDLLPVVEANCFLEPIEEYMAEYVPHFSEDDKTIFVRSTSERVLALDTKTGKESVKSLYTGRVQAIVADSHCKTWICCGESYARLWTLEKNKSGEVAFAKHLPRLAHQDAVTSADFGTNGIVVTSGMDQLVKIWPASPIRGSSLRFNDRENSHAVLPHQAQIVLVKFSNNGKHLVTVQLDGLVRVWVVPDFGPDRYTMRMSPSYGIGHVAEVDHWFTLGASDAGYSIDMRRVRDGQIMANIPSNRLEGRGKLLGAEVSVDQKLFATLHSHSPSRKDAESTNSKHDVQLWTHPDGKPLGEPISLPETPHDLIFHPRLPQLALIDANREIHIVEIATRKSRSLGNGLLAKERLNDQLGVVTASPAAGPATAKKYRIGYSPDGAFFVTWGNEPNATVWDSHSLKERFHFSSPHDKPIEHLKIAPNGKRIAIVHKDDRSVWTIDTQDGVSKSSIPHSLAINSIDWNAISSSLVTSGEDGRVRVIDVATGDSFLSEMLHPRSVAQSVFSPNGKLIATLCLDGLIRIWSAEDGLLLMKPIRVSNAIRRIAFGGSTHLALIGVSGQIDVLDFSRNLRHQEINVTDVATLAELISGKAVSSHGTVNLTTTQWMQRWREYVRSSGR